MGVFWLFVTLLVGSACADVDYSNILYSKTASVASDTHFVDKVAGDYCCHECVFLPTFQPCAVVPAGLYISGARYIESYNPQSFNPPKCYVVAPDIVVYDEMTMCFQSEDRGSRYVNLNQWYRTADTFNSPAQSNQFGASNWNHPWGNSDDPNGDITRYLVPDSGIFQPQGPVCLHTNDWNQGGIDHLSDDDYVSHVMESAPYIPISRQNINPGTVIPATMFPWSYSLSNNRVILPDGSRSSWQFDGNAAARSHAAAWVAPFRNSGRHRQGFNILAANTDTGAPVFSQRLSLNTSIAPLFRCTTGPICFDDLTNARMAKTLKSDSPYACSRAAINYDSHKYDNNPVSFLGFTGGKGVDGAKTSIINNCEDQKVYRASLNDGYMFPMVSPYNIELFCDAPKDPTSAVCSDLDALPVTNTDLQNYITSGVVKTIRGCAGYGICPTDKDGNVCSNQGQCMTNAKCYCNSGWGGLACDIAIPSATVYSCDQFDPCSEQGYCVDSASGPICTCYPGWIGSTMGLGPDPAVNGVINVYANAFLCNITTCPSTSSDPMAAYVTAYNYMKDHQCLFFAGDRDGVLLKRYLRTSAHFADTVTSDSLADSSKFPYAFVPLWYNGSTDHQLYSNYPGGVNPNAPYFIAKYNNGDLVRVTQVVKRGYNCIDGRTVQPSDRALQLPPEDLPDGRLRGGPGCEVCPNCFTNQSVCVPLENYCSKQVWNSTAVDNMWRDTHFKELWLESIEDMLAKFPVSGPALFAAYNRSLVAVVNNLTTRAYAIVLGGRQPNNSFEWSSVFAYATGQDDGYQYEPFFQYVCTRIPGFSDALGNVFGTAGQTDVTCAALGLGVVTEELVTKLPPQWQCTGGASGMVCDNLFMRDYILSYSTGWVICNKTIDTCDNCYNSRFSVARRCECFPNFGSRDPANAICDAQICPTAPNATLLCGTANCTTDLVCSGIDRGTCVPTGGTYPYLGYCQCRRGYTGPACELSICPSTSASEPQPPAGLGPKLMCGGFIGTADPNLPVNSTSRNSIPPALDCDIVNRTCVCNEPWFRLNPVTGLCDLPGCVTSKVSGLECNGLMVYGSPTRSNLYSVCDRNVTSTGLGTCVCTAARYFGDVVQPQTNYSFFGAACDIPYASACTDPVTRSYCGNSGDCYVDGSELGVRPPDPTVAPYCHCTTSFTGKYCNRSLCDPTAFGPWACGTNGQIAGSCAALPSGCADPQKCGSASCPVGSVCSWSCFCQFVETPSLLRTCSASTPSANCTYFGKRDGLSCQYDMQGCVYYNTKIRQWTICNQKYASDGESMCYTNSTGSFCSCPVGYTGRYCEVQLGCNGYCDGKCDTAAGVCDCGYFRTGETRAAVCNATVPCCNVTTCGGSYPGNLTDNQCTCPSGSSYRHPNLPVPSKMCLGGSGTGTFQGCGRDCPKDALGYECGGCGFYLQSSTRQTRCSSLTTLAGTGSAPTCSCSLLGFDPWPGTFSSRPIPWTLSSTGVCEPYCMRNGGNYIAGSLGNNPISWDESTTNFTICQCNPGFSGQRCNISLSPLVCYNNGTANYNYVPPKCVCNPNGVDLDFPWFSSTNCSVLMCETYKSSYDKNYNPTRCKCRPPYGYANSQDFFCSNICKNGGIPDTSTGACRCFRPWYGKYCDQTDCTNPNPTSTSCSCPQAYQVYSNVSGTCVNVTCPNGNVDKNGICQCIFPWGGVNCTTDRCATGGSSGVAVYSNGGWSCVCTTGMGKDERGLCTSDKCGVSGRPVPCTPSVDCPSLTSPFKCLCGNGTQAIDPNTYLPYCNPPTSATCKMGDIIEQDGQMWCVCKAGWSNGANSNVMCDTYNCDLTANPTSYWNTSTSACDCYLPWASPPACNTYRSNCGPGSITPVTNGQPHGQITSLIVAISNPLVAFNPFKISIPQWQCACATGYTLANNNETWINPGVRPCMRACSFPGTFSRNTTTCVCRDFWMGDLCDVAVPTVRITPGSSSSSFPDWAIGLVAGLGGAFLLSGIVLAIWWNYFHLPSRLLKPKSTPENNKLLKKSSVSRNRRHGSSMISIRPEV